MASVLFTLIVFFSPYVIGPTSVEFLQMFLLIILVLTFVIPLISIAMLKLTGAISSFHMESRRERVLPFVLITIYYGVSVYLILDKLPLNDLVQVILYTITLLLALLSVITIFWKISAHAIAVGGVLGFLCGINLLLPENELFIPIVIVSFLSGLIMSARLLLNAHNPPQVYTGAFLGFFLSFSALLIFGQ